MEAIVVQWHKLADVNGYEFNSCSGVLGYISYFYFLEAGRGAVARGVTVKTDWLWVRSPIIYFLALVPKQSAVLRSFNTQCLKNSTESGERTCYWGTDCLNTRHPGSICLPCYEQDTREAKKKEKI